MATQADSTSRARWQQRRRAVLAAVLGAVVAFGAVWLLADPGPSEAQRREELLAYLDELKPLAEEAGTVVIHGLRAGVNDIPQKRFEDDQLRTMARGWRHDLEAVKRKLAALTPPERLSEAHATLVSSMDGFIEVTQMLEQAIDAPDDERRRLSTQAAALGEKTDRVWNVGAYDIQRELVALGEDMVIWLPDPTVNPDGDVYVDGDPDPDTPNTFLPEE